MSAAARGCGSACQTGAQGTMRTHRAAAPLQPHARHLAPPAAAGHAPGPQQQQGDALTSQPQPWASEELGQAPRARSNAFAPSRLRTLNSTPLIDLSSGGVGQGQRSGLGPRRLVSAADQGVCSSCAGVGSIPCKACSGTGAMGRGGFNKRNPIPKDVISSKWTAMAPTIGWRHFRVIKQRKSTTPPSPAATSPSAGGRSSFSTPAGTGAQAPAAAAQKQKQTVFVLMQASCDATAQLWVNREALRDRSQWAAGWLLRSEMGIPVDQEPGEREEGPGEGEGEVPTRGQGQAGSGSKPCRPCGGTGVVLCRACDASGVLPIDL